MTTHLHAVPAAAPGRPAPPSTRWLALAVLCLTLLMATLDVTVLNVALPAIVRDLNTTTTQLQWIIDAYVIVFAGLLSGRGVKSCRENRLGSCSIFSARASRDVPVRRTTDIGP